MATIAKAPEGLTEAQELNLGARVVTFLAIYGINSAYNSGVLTFGRDAALTPEARQYLKHEGMTIIEKSPDKPKLQL